MAGKLAVSLSNHERAVCSRPSTGSGRGGACGSGTTAAERHRYRRGTWHRRRRSPASGRARLARGVRGHDGDALAPVAAETGGIAVQCDVGREADVERLIAVARAHLGRIDAIVSNAGDRRLRTAARDLAGKLEPRAGHQPHSDVPAGQGRGGRSEADARRDRGHRLDPGAHVGARHAGLLGDQGRTGGAHAFPGDDAGARGARQLRVARAGSIRASMAR